MPRNGAGGYTLPEAPFVARTTISSTSVNNDLSDLGQQITNSVAADGQTPNIGPLKALAGSPGGPSYSFQSDSQSGFYLAGAGQVGLALGGVNVATFGPTTITYGGAVLSGVPTASITAFAGSAAPSGWLLCFGQAVNRVGVAAALFAAIGTTYGIGDGTNTFNLPDLRGRIVAGLDNMGGTAAGILTAATITDGGGPNASGGSGGNEQITLTHDQIPAHTHPITDPGHLHTYTAIVGAAGAGAGAGAISSATQNTSTNTTGITATDANTPADAAHFNVQPTMVMNFIIKL